MLPFRLKSPVIPWLKGRRQNIDNLFMTVLYSDHFPFSSKGRIHLQVHVNGVRQEIPPETTVFQLLAQLKILPERVVVEINLKVIDRAEYRRSLLKEGDRIEIIGFVGGGV